MTEGPFQWTVSAQLITPASARREIGQGRRQHALPLRRSRGLEWLMSKPPRKPSPDVSMPEAQSLAGQFLIAMPGMADKRFARSVIYMCVHSADTAMGIIINRRADSISFSEMLEHLDLEGLGASDDGAEIADMEVHFGGPVETSRGFVLHTPDYQTKKRTLAVEPTICLTATVDILKAIAVGKGPSKALLALGYAGWAGGQLEAEIRANGWLHCPADTDIIFDPVLENKYERALRVDQAHLVSDAGNA
jgi:putative transcriptional regulator